MNGQKRRSIILVVAASASFAAPSVAQNGAPSSDVSEASVERELEDATAEVERFLAPIHPSVELSTWVPTPAEFRRLLELAMDSNETRSRRLRSIALLGRAEPTLAAIETREHIWRTIWTDQRLHPALRVQAATSAAISMAALDRDKSTRRVPLLLHALAKTNEAALVEVAIRIGVRDARIPTETLEHWATSSPRLQKRIRESRVR